MSRSWNSNSEGVGVDRKLDVDSNERHGPSLRVLRWDSFESQNTPKYCAYTFLPNILLFFPVELSENIDSSTNIGPNGSDFALKTKKVTSVVATKSIVDGL